MTKALLLAALVALLSIQPTDAAAKESHAKRGYLKKDGTYVAPSRATNPDKTRQNIYTSKGNTNPYTGKRGTKDPYKK